MIFNLKRVDRPELMDTITIDEPEMLKVLSFLEMTNIYFGGYSAIISFLENWSVNWERTKCYSFLDIGTGLGDIPIKVVKWARAKGFNIKILAIDLMSNICSLAKERASDFPEITIRQMDYRELKDEFDYVFCSLFLHHIPPKQTSDTVLAMSNLTRRGLIISDLRRSWGSFFSVSFTSWLLGNHIVKNDGPLSVKRSFTVDELSRVSEELGLSYLKTRSMPWFRLALAGEK